MTRSNYISCAHACHERSISANASSSGRDGDADDSELITSFRRRTESTA